MLKGLTSESSFTATTKLQSFVSIPDIIFEKHLVNKKIDKYGLLNGKLQIVDAKGITELSLDSTARNLKSLSGIETFFDLQILNCINKKL